MRDLAAISPQSPQPHHTHTLADPAWAHNPVALLSVCLLSMAHEHAAELVLQFGKLEVNVPFLVQARLAPLVPGFSFLLCIPLFS